MTDGRGNRTTYIYDQVNRAKEINRAGIQVERLVYDGVGNVIAYNDGFGGDVTYRYDGLDNPMMATDGVGNTTLLEFDGEGLLREKVEPKGVVAGSGQQLIGNGTYTTRYEYNALRSLVRVVDAKQGEWVYGYDDGQNLTSVRDGLMRVTAYEYDVLDRVKRVTQPENTISEYEYDENSNRVTITDAKGQKTRLAYDELDRVRQADYFTVNDGMPVEGPRRHIFGYDPEANITSTQEINAVNNTATPRSYARTYDARDRVESETDANNRVVRFQYDAANNLTKITDASLRETLYGYDGRNRLSNVEMSGSRTATYSWCQRPCKNDPLALI